MKERYPDYVVSARTPLSLETPGKVEQKIRQTLTNGNKKEPSRSASATSSRGNSVEVRVFFADFYVSKID